MFTRISKLLAVAAFGFTLVAAGPVGAQSVGADGLVKVKSAYGVDETVARLKSDIAAKGIMFFRQSINRSLPPARAFRFVRPRC